MQVNGQCKADGEENNCEDEKGTEEKQGSD